MVIDDDSRMVILEGLAMPGGGMQSIFMDLPRPKENDHNFKMLCNPEILFPDRLYPSFGPELKRIRLRDKLKKLTRRPELYNRKQVDEECFASFDGLLTLRSAPDLRSTRDLAMYPTTASVATLELLYGEAVSRADLDGLAAEAHRVAMLEQKRREKQAREKGGVGGAAAGSGSGAHEAPLTPQKGRGSDVDPMSSAHTTPSHSPHPHHTHTPSQPSPHPDDHDHDHTSNDGSRSGSAGLDSPNSSSNSSPLGRKRGGPSDCRNASFEAHLLTRPEHRVDHLQAAREGCRRGWLQMLARREVREEEAAEAVAVVLGKEGTQGGRIKVYTYSNNAENFQVPADWVVRNRCG